MTKDAGTKPVLFCILLACGLWYLTFSARLLNFWLSMTLAVTILTSFSLAFGGSPRLRAEITAGNFLKGMLAAAVLYGVFGAGNLVSQNLFNFAKPEISAIYDIRQEGQLYLVTLILLFVTSPGEEFFWRGFLQRWAMRRFGAGPGWLAVALLYGAVHLVSGNIMLVLAALVAGLFWGWLYRSTGSLFACIISHALWTVAIFVLFPIM